MGEINILAKKAIVTLKAEGFSMVMWKARRYLELRSKRKNINNPEKTFADVLFVNGCYLPHPSRYRVTHQREQLWAGDISSNEVFFTDLTLEMARMYRVFIFFRCPYTDTIGQFIETAKKDNKVVLYDIDDLVIDQKYTQTVKYLETMSESELASYYSGLELNQKALRLCDGAITTTEQLAEELKNYVSNVYINRNVASEEMLKLSEEAIAGKAKKTDKKIRIGYFSGSITHNDDFGMILPVLVRLMKRYENLILVVVGELTLPECLKEFADQIENEPFCDWKKLPQLISSVDINLAPLENSKFNAAKSENKWVEAALVKVPTIASNVGAFTRMVTSNENGILCDTEDEWEKNLTSLIEDADLRKKIGDNAYVYCKEHCTSVYTAAPFSQYIRNIMKPNILFALPTLQLSGGSLVVLKHCTFLKEAGYDVTILNYGSETTKYVMKDDIRINVINYYSISISTYLDKAVATLWTTTRLFSEYSKIGKRYYNVQNFETDFYRAGESFKLEANRTYNSLLPIKYITISKWCQSWLNDKFGKESGYAPNGIYTEKFYPARRNWAGRKLRILVEGNSCDYYKNVDESFRIIELLDKKKYEIWYMSYLGKPKDGYYVDRFLHMVPYEEVPQIYRECDILIKSSILESFSYPPLEMMATGGYVVVAPNNGNVEYLENEKNCLFYEHDNLMTAVHAIDRIANDERLRNILYENGIATARIRDWKKLKDDILNLYDVKVNEVCI